MSELEKLQERMNELVGKPKSKEEIDEFIELSRKVELELGKEISELIFELSKKGIHISTIWDLVNTKKPYPEAIDILIDHLNKNYHEKNIEGIVRALTVKEAKGKATSTLIKQFENIPKEKNNLRWIVGNAIANVMTLKDVNWIYSIVLDKNNGSSRGQLVYCLGNIKSEKSEDVLISLLEDVEVAPQALAGLARLKSKRAKDKINSMVHSTNALVRLEAKKALKKIELVFLRKRKIKESIIR